MNVEINEIFKPLFTTKKRYIFMTGGRASLKSTTAHSFIALLTLESGHGVLFTRYTMTSAEKSIIPEFNIAIERLGLVNQFHVTKNQITNINTGSFIIFSGIKTSSGNQTANLKSLAGITTWVIEEGEDFNDEKAFDTIDDSIRTKGKQNRVIWIQNPTTKEHFIYKRWIEPFPKQIDLSGHKVTVSGHPDVEHIHSWYKIATKYLSESFLKKASKSEKENPKWFYHNYVVGWLEKAEGVIFENWEIGEFDYSLPYGYGLDFGSKDPDALTRVAIDHKRMILYVKEELYKSGLSTNELGLIVKSICEHKLIIADSASPRTLQDLDSLGLNIKGVKKPAGSIIEGIKVMQNYKIIVHPDSNNLVKELNNYIWVDKRGGVPIDDYNHLLDGFRYYVSHTTKKQYSVFL